MGQIVRIRRIRVDAEGHLRIQPCTIQIDGHTVGYHHIYRAAMSVRWDRNEYELFVIEVPGFGLPEEFRQIISAVAGEYGHDL